MATVTLNPDGTGTGSYTSGTPTTVGGAGSIHATLADVSDATYIAIDGPPNGVTDSIKILFSSFTFPSLSQIRSVTGFYRSNATEALDRLQVGLLDNGTASLIHLLQTTAITDKQGTDTHSTALDGSLWTQARVDAIEMAFTGIADTNGNASLINLYKAYINVVYNEVPVVTVTGPTEGGTVTNTTRPTITWTFTDPENDTQERYQVKIFSAAQYGIGGFNAETSPNTWSSGEVLSASGSVVVGLDLTNTVTYRAYVKIADAGSNGRYSLWDNNTFTINVTAPPAPSLTVTAQPANATGPRTKLDIVRTSNATPTTYMTIEYSDNAGVTWGFLNFSGPEAYPFVTAGSIVNTPDGTAFTYYDYTAIPGVQRSYRAKAVRTV